MRQSRCTSFMMDRFQRSFCSHWLFEFMNSGQLQFFAASARSMRTILLRGRMPLPLWSMTHLSRPSASCSGSVPWCIKTCIGSIWLITKSSVDRDRQWWDAWGRRHRSRFLSDSMSLVQWICSGCVGVSQMGRSSIYPMWLKRFEKWQTLKFRMLFHGMLRLIAS